jgi:hypothetical protein
LAYRVTGSIHHVVEGYWAHVGADAVSDADIPIHRRSSPVDTKGLWRIYWAPYFVAVMFVSCLAFSLKIRVYWQKQFTTLVLKRADIKGFFSAF